MMVAAALNQIRKEGAVLAGLSMKLHAFFFFGNKTFDVFVFPRGQKW